MSMASGKVVGARSVSGEDVMASREPAIIPELSPKEDKSNIEEEEEETIFIERWAKVIELIRSTTRSACANSPMYDPKNPLPFKTYWRKIFLPVQDSLANDTSVPEHITEPPIQHARIVLFAEKHVGSCPCCLPDVPASVDLLSRTGVTKNDLIRGFLNHMFGEGKSPQVYGGHEDEEEYVETTRAGKGWSVFSANWMTSGGTREQKNACVAYGDDDEAIAEIWMCCCDVDKVEEKIREEEEAKKARERRREENRKQKDPKKI